MFERKENLSNYWKWKVNRNWQRHKNVVYICFELPYDIKSNILEHISAFNASLFEIECIEYHLNDSTWVWMVA